MRVSLRVIKGPGRGAAWEFSAPGAFLIGRGDGVDLQLSPTDPYASRRHAYLEISPPVCRLQNLSQKNAAVVNRKPISDQCELQDGDVVEIGFTQISVSVVAAETPSADRPISQGVPSSPHKDGGDGKARDALVTAACHFCGADLSKSANADGRAAELSAIAIYSCPGCLPQGDQHEGKELAHYTIRRCLGVGGMGTVYLATAGRTNRLVAVKVILDIPERELAARFTREVAVLRNISLPHVLRYVDSGTADDVPYLVTEYVPDGNLDDLKLKGHLTLAASTEITIGLLSGLASLHEKGIIHRDVKPANILLRFTRDGNPAVSWWPVIADFGLALTYAKAGGARLTKPGSVLGTVMFMPPEQIRDPHNVGVTADVYAAGVTLYYLLSSRYPYEFPTPSDVAEFEHRMGRARNPREALQALMQYHHLRHPYVIVLEDEPVSLGQRNAHVPKDLVELVDAAIVKNPNRRIQTAGELAAGLRRVLDRYSHGVDAQRGAGRDAG